MGTKNKMTASIYASWEINNRGTDNNRARLTCTRTAKTKKRWEVWNVTTVDACITSPSVRNIKKRETGTRKKHEDIKRRMVSKLHRFADNNCIDISEAFFNKEIDTDSLTPQIMEEEVNKLCQALEQSDSEWLSMEAKETHVNEAKTEDSKPIPYKVTIKQYTSCCIIWPRCRHEHYVFKIFQVTCQQTQSL